MSLLLISATRAVLALYWAWCTVWCFLLKCSAVFDLYLCLMVLDFRYYGTHVSFPMLVAPSNCRKQLWWTGVKKCVFWLRWTQKWSCVKFAGSAHVCVSSLPVHRRVSQSCCFQLLAQRREVCSSRSVLLQIGHVRRVLPPFSHFVPVECRPLSTWKHVSNTLLDNF